MFLSMESLTMLNLEVSFVSFLLTVLIYDFMSLCFILRCAVAAIPAVAFVRIKYFGRATLAHLEIQDGGWVSIKGEDAWYKTDWCKFFCDVFGIGQRENVSVNVSVVSWPENQAEEGMKIRDALKKWEQASDEPQKETETEQEPKQVKQASEEPKKETDTEQEPKQVKQASEEPKKETETEQASKQVKKASEEPQKKSESVPDSDSSEYEFEHNHQWHEWCLFCVHTFDSESNFKRVEPDSDLSSEEPDCCGNFDSDSETETDLSDGSDCDCDTSDSVSETEFTDRSDWDTTSDSESDSDEYEVEEFSRQEDASEESQTENLSHQEDTSEERQTENVYRQEDTSEEAEIGNFSSEEDSSDESEFDAFSRTAYVTDTSDEFEVVSSEESEFEIVSHETPEESESAFEIVPPAVEPNSAFHFFQQDTYVLPEDKQHMIWNKLHSSFKEKYYELESCYKERKPDLFGKRVEVTKMINDILLFQNLKTNHPFLSEEDISNINKCVYKRPTIPADALCKVLDEYRSKENNEMA